MYILLYYTQINALISSLVFLIVVGTIKEKTRDEIPPPVLEAMLDTLELP